MLEQAHEIMDRWREGDSVTQRAFDTIRHLKNTTSKR